VIVPSWSVRRTATGKPRASRPADREAIISTVPPAACSSSGDGRLRPPFGSNR